MALTIVADTLPVFPVDIAYGFPGGPEFITDVVVLDNRNEQRNSFSDQPLHSWDVGFLLKEQPEFYNVRRFFNACRGRAHPFRFKDWEDFKSCAVYATNGFADQSLGAATAGQTAFQLVKSYAQDDYETFSDVTKPIGSTVRIGVNGVEVTSGWTVDETTGIITRGSALSGGEVITWGGQFYRKARFDTDKWPGVAEGFDIGSVQLPIVELLS